jgi:pyruvate carboxylase subunit B
MSKREIKFSLIYRDMWQSSGKYQPRVDQLVRIAPVIIDMGCFARVETNGGAFEQVNLLYGENPNKAVREWTKDFNKVGIQTHMLERALNGIRMFPVPADVRKLMFEVKQKQGTNIARSFCGLNDHRNLKNSILFANEAGMISQTALCITHSKLHTVEYYMGVVDKAVEYGTKEICLKDMAGIGRPATLGKLVRAIKQKYPHLLVQYHGHSGPGFSVASMLEVARAGADILDVAIEPLSWGMVHPDLLTIHEMLTDDGFLVPDINMNAYMEARALTQEFIDDFLGLFIDPKNKHLSSLLISSGLPGGMMGSLMADLKGMHAAINMNLKARGEDELNEDQLLVKMFDEVAHIWPMLGYPPLVTPYSQYVKNTALMNILQMAKGEKRFSAIDKNTWDMILGKAGTLPGELAPEVVELAKEQGKEFYDGEPQDAYPDELDKYRKEMDENGWEYGEDDEELLEFAMHETQYRDYKSGEAKKRFEADVEKIRAQKEQNNTTTMVSTHIKQAPNRGSYSKNEAELKTAIAGFMLYTLNSDKIVEDEKPQKANIHNVWAEIGFWRHLNNTKIINGEEEIEIEVETAGDDKYRLTFGENIIEPKLIYVGAGEVDFQLDGKKFFASFSPCEEGTKVTINKKEFCLSRLDLLSSDDILSSDSAAGEGDNLIKAPIPGKIFKMNVKEGDEVKKGDVVLVIDAMKMENNIESRMDGVVKEVKVSEGDMVEGNDLLVELE